MTRFMITTSALSTWLAAWAKSITLRSTRSLNPFSFSRPAAAILTRFGAGGPLAEDPPITLLRAAVAHVSTSVALAAGFIPAATMPFIRPSVAPSGYLDKSQPYTGKRAAPSRSDRAMRGNHLGSLSYFSQPAAAPEEIQLDQRGDDHRPHADRKRPVRALEDAGQIREVHAKETGEKAQRQEQAGDHGQRLRGLVEPVRDRREINVHRARQQVAQRVRRFVLTHDVVVDVAVVQRHVRLLQVDAVRDQGLEDVALRAKESAQFRDAVFQVIDALERLLCGLLGDLVFQLVHLVIELLQDRKGGVDEGVDGEVGEEGRLAVRQVRALVDPLRQRLQLRRGLLMDRDQIVRADIEMVLAKHDFVVLPV